VPDEKKTPIPDWDKIDKIALQMEKLFFEQSAEMEISPYEMSIILNRVVMLFDEYKMLLVRTHLSEGPNVQFKGSTHLYK